MHALCQIILFSASSRTTPSGILSKTRELNLISLIWRRLVSGLSKTWIASNASCRRRWTARHKFATFTIWNRSLRDRRTESSWVSKSPINKSFGFFGNFCIPSLGRTSKWQKPNKPYPLASAFGSNAFGGSVRSIRFWFDPLYFFPCSQFRWRSGMSFQLHGVAK